MRHPTLLLTAALLTTACGEAEAPDPSDPASAMDAFFEEFTAEWVRGNPDQAVATRYFDGEEQRALEQQLTPRTREWQLERVALARRGLERLSTFDLSEVPDAQRVSAEVMRWQLEAVVIGEPYLDYAFALEQMNGANASLPSAIIVTHPVTSEGEAASYVARMEQMDERMREAMAEARRRAAAGILPPRFIVESTIEQMEQFVAPEPADNPLVTTLVTKMGEVPSLDGETRENLAARAASIVAGEVYPVWREAIELLRSQLPRTTDDAGIWRLEGGAEAYADALRRYTTTDLSAGEIHEIGLREVARIEARLDTLLARVGIVDGTLNERIEELRRRLAYPVTDEGRRRIMADIDEMLSDALERSQGLFGRMPEADVIARPYPEFRWETDPASYTAPPLDGSRPGLFQMPLRADELTRFALRSLVYHETVPGHHFQIALANEDPSLPRFRQMRAFGTISASTEGWALYAEHLAAEQGWYEDDVEGLIGQLESQLFRARRLVVDTGLHAMRWTRQQAIDYGMPPSEVDRYVVWPGQACSYMIGQLRIIELRERAREALASSFSLSDFHDVVLGVGSVPLGVLESEVERWVRSAQ